ncbi:hypothetical protein BaRGS_00011282 [Batillaria attramentaria]|uniref:Exonuclease V n=1 Tax=Batillaria attramentaria TaxID=370345 RepID=A0ABD0LDN2_9CAEN
MSTDDSAEWSDADESLLARLDYTYGSQEGGTEANETCSGRTEVNISADTTVTSDNDITHKSGQDSATHSDSDTCVASRQPPTTGVADKGENPLTSGNFNPLTMFIKSQYFTVTDLTTQLWCEQHMLYALMGIEPQPPEPLEGEVQVPVPLKTADRPEVKAGKSVHLARELEIHDFVKVKISSKGEKWAVHILNLLSAIQGFLSGISVVREVPVFGDPFGTGDLFFGIIDELRFDQETYSVQLSELKTRKSERLPGKAQKKQHIFQVQVYKRLWDNLVRGEFSADHFLTKLSLTEEADQPLSDEIVQLMDASAISAETLRQLLTNVLSAAQSLVCISSTIIEYVQQDTGISIGQTKVQDDEERLLRAFHWCMEFWHGRREVQGVEIEEAWKCHSCEYASICEWRQQKCEEYRLKNALQS